MTQCWFQQSGVASIRALASNTSRSFFNSSSTYAEYLCLPEKPAALLSVMAEKPNNVSYEDTAAIPLGGLEAKKALKSDSTNATKKQNYDSAKLALEKAKIDKELAKLE